MRFSESQARPSGVGSHASHQTALGASGKWPRIRASIVICAAVVFALFTVASVDFSRTRADAPLLVPSTFDHCQGAANVQQCVAGPYTQVNSLQSDYDARAWGYALGAVAAIVAGLALSLRHRWHEELRDAFRNLGVVGVLTLIGTVLLLSEASRGGVGFKAPWPQAFLPAASMLATAALGSLVVWGSTRASSSADAMSAAAPRTVGGRAVFDRWLPIVMIGLVGVTVVLAVALGGCDRFGETGIEHAARSAANILVWSQFFGAFVCLLRRRWVLALIALASFVFEAMALSGITCG